jgi:hypothetical protein
VGYELLTPDGYPEAFVALETKPRALARETSIAAMRRIALRDGWEGYGLDDPTTWSGVWRATSLAGLLSEEEHVAAVQRFFVEAIRQLKEELTAFKKAHPELPWSPT